MILLLYILPTILSGTLHFFAEAVILNEVEPFLHPDTGLTPIELIKRYNYPLEEHWVTTTDGYTLALHRIPYGVNNQDNTDRPAVLVMHDLAGSSAEFVNMGPANSVAYLLAEEGYDVWLGNARGNTWSRNHTMLDPNEKDFWQFSWHEIGVIDIPAMIDYILERTDQESLYYLGHGQGNTVFFVMASQRPEYNDKIRVMAATSPMAYMIDFISPVYLIASQLHEVIEWVLDLLGFYELMPHSDLIRLIASMFCDDGNPYQDICADIFFYFDGFSYSQMNATMIPVILSNYPAGASAKQYIHYLQNIRLGTFRQYDYGTLQNSNIYGQALPPDYDVTTVTAPVALFYSSNDWMASVAAVERLAELLPNIALVHQVSLSTFNHNDFVFGIDVKSLVYDQIFYVFRQY